jgi:hypothetical protein
MMARDRELPLPSIVLILHLAAVCLVKVLGNRCTRNQVVALRHGRDVTGHVGPLGDYSEPILVVHIEPVHTIEQLDAFDALGQIGAFATSDHRTSDRPT